MGTLRFAALYVVAGLWLFMCKISIRFVMCISVLLTQEVDCLQNCENFKLI